MIKVTFFITFNPDPRLIKRMITFQKSGFKVSLIYANRGIKQNQSLEQYGVECYEIKFSGSNNRAQRIVDILGCKRQIDDIISTVQPDLLYINGLDALIISRLAYGSLGNKPFVYEVSDLPGGRWRKGRVWELLFNKLETLLMYKVSLLVLTSPYFADYYPQKYQNKTFLFENVPERRILGKYVNKRRDEFTVGFVGLSGYDRPMINLIDGLGGVDGVKIIIAGPPKDGTAISEQAMKYKNVKFLGPFQYERDIVDIYSQVDAVFAVYDPSLDNVRVALPNKLYESIVCSLPILVSEGTKLGEFIEKNGIGKVVNPYDKNSIRKSILELASNNEMILRIKKNCNEIKDKYYYEEVESQFVKVISGLVNIGTN